METTLSKSRFKAQALCDIRATLAADLGVADRERLAGWLENKGKTILPEPEAKLTAASRMPAKSASS